MSVALVLFAFGFVGYLFDRYRFSALVFVLAFILGQLAETALGRSMMMFDGDVTGFFTRPISAVLLLPSAWTGVKAVRTRSLVLRNQNP